MSNRREHYSVEDNPKWQNRRGPDGEILDPTEAATWFPELAVAKLHPFPREIATGDSVLVGCIDITARFWLHNVTVSQETGYYFGDIIDELPDNVYCLNRDQNIGFEARHVFELRHHVDCDAMSIRASNRDVLHLGDRIAVHGMRGVVDGERGIVVQVSAQWLLVRTERGASMYIHERFVRPEPAAAHPDTQENAQ